MMGNIEQIYHFLLRHSCLQKIYHKHYLHSIKKLKDTAEYTFLRKLVYFFLYMEKTKEV